MSDNKKTIAGIGVVLFLLLIGALIGVIIWLFTRTPSDSCDYSQTVEIEDEYMRPFLLPKVEVDYYPNYYKCNPIQKGDIVVYQVGTIPTKRYRVAAAVGGDEVVVLSDKENRGWNVTVNGTMVMNNDKPYFFGIHKVNPVINLFLINGKKKLHDDELLLFATVPPGYLDSGLYGLYTSRSGIFGRIVLPDDRRIEFDEYFLKMYSEEAGKEALAKQPLLPKQVLAKPKPVPSNKPVAPVVKKPSKGKPQKRR